MTHTKPPRTVEEIQAEIMAEQRRLAEVPPPPFCEQENILRRIIDLLNERKAVGNEQ